MKELDGNILNGNPIKVNAKGLENGRRQKEDGIAYFGNASLDEEVRFI
jgi:hypothetical protein